MDSKYMKVALSLAEEAYADKEVPIGAVIVKNGEIIAKGRNMRETKQNSLSHAEIEAINAACKKLGSWRLDDCSIYVTLEPCPMCMGAILNSRISTLVFGAYDLENGFAESVESMQNLCKYGRLDVYGGVLEEKCEKLIKDFFRGVRTREQ